MKIDKYDLASKLTKLQRKFVINLVSGMSQRQAYLKAGGTSKTARVQDAVSCRMLTDVKVKAYYDSLIKESEKSSIMTREEALERLTVSSRSNLLDFVKMVQANSEEEDDIKVVKNAIIIKDLDSLPRDLGFCIKSISPTTAGYKIELYDSNASIKQLSEMMGWNAPKKTEVTGKDGNAIAVDTKVEAPEVMDALNSLMDKL